MPGKVLHFILFGIICIQRGKIQMKLLNKQQKMSDDY